MFDHQGQFYGTGTIGERGQIVIPAKARAKLKIKAGENFIFFGHGPMLHLVKAEQIDDILDKITQKFTKDISKLRGKIKAKS